MGNPRLAGTACQGQCNPTHSAAVSLCLWVQLEEELKVRIEAWEHEHEEAFLVNGQQFMEYVSEQWQLHQLEKEKEKQERVSAELNKVQV